MPESPKPHTPPRRVRVYERLGRAGSSQAKVVGLIVVGLIIVGLIILVAIITALAW